MKRVIGWLCLTFALVLAAAASLLGWALHDVPELSRLPDQLKPPSIRITDRYDRLLYEVLPAESGRQRSLALEQIPLALRQATIATEDNRFYEHPGVDWISILRALWINLRGGKVIVGGSTITQQVARNLLLDDAERYRHSYLRKIREAYLAWQLTRRFSKDDILALYLNQTYYGGMAYGVEAAAQTFFGKPAAELDLAECALLAGLPQAPALYNPYTNPDLARQRQRVVLDLMQKAGYITAEQNALAARENLIYTESPYPMEAPHFVLMVQAELDQLLSQEVRRRAGGLTVRTTLDLDWQRLAEAAVRRQLEKLKNTPDGLGHNVNSAALVALAPRTGQILTLVGSPDYWDAANAGAVNMALAMRQPGSALKPILYAAALSPDQTHPWTAATSILDVSTSFITQQGEAYTPVNYDLQEHGPVLLRQALASSLNIPAVITLQQVGIERLLTFTRRMGITTLANPDDYDLSLALGGGEVRLLDLAAAYAVFANQGWRVTPQAILDIYDAQGELVYAPSPPAAERVLDERVAWLISDILSDDKARSLGFGVNSVLQIERTAAVKTGTTSNFHDNWAIGYTPSLLVGVWVGNPNHEPMRGVSGVTGAAPIWHNFIRSVLSGRPDEPFPRPPGLIQVEVCSLSGLLPTDACPYRAYEWFIAGTQPAEYDTYHKKVFLDALTGRLADANTPPERRIERIALDLPPQAHPWARQAGLLLLSDLQKGSAAPLQPDDSGVATALLKLVSPASHATYLITSDLPRSVQKLSCEAVGPATLTEVVFWLDGQEIGRSSAPPYRVWWTLEEGSHRLFARGVLETGETLQSEEISFEVSVKE